MKRIGYAIAVVFSLIACTIAFCINSTDAQTARAFADAVTRWQSNPDFRVVTFQYVDLGCSAMRCRAWGFPARQVITTFRKLPGLPPTLALAGGSQLHYDDFSRGPVGAYLRLSSEQGVEGGVGIIEKLGPTPTDEQIRQILNDFKLPRPTTSDAGAIASVRRVIADVHPDRPFSLRGSVGPQMQTGIQALANSIGQPDIDHLSVQQQVDLLRRYDEQLATTDPELWRTKQVNDLLAGIWAQAYGQFYATGIHIALLCRLIGRIVLGVEIVAICVVFILRRNVNAKTPKRQEV